MQIAQNMPTIIGFMIKIWFTWKIMISGMEIKNQIENNYLEKFQKRIYSMLISTRGHSYTTRTSNAISPTNAGFRL